MALRVVRSTADMRDEPHGAVHVLLLEGGDNPVDASVAVHLERTSAVGDSVQTAEIHNRRSHKLT